MISDEERWQRRQRAANRRRQLRVRAIEYKGGRCEICRYDKSPAAFDFHHVNPLEKDFEISSAPASWDLVKRELDRCVLLCCRCHREVHDGLHPGFLVLEDRGPEDDDLGDEL
jgi:hypothetical protein